MSETKSAESVASLVERLEKRAQYYENASKQVPSALVSSIQRETAQELREAASRLSSPKKRKQEWPIVCDRCNCNVYCGNCDRECC